MMILSIVSANSWINTRTSLSYLLFGPLRSLVHLLQLSMLSCLSKVHIDEISTPTDFLNK
jgi:hypothetical protein